MFQTNLVASGIAPNAFIASTLQTSTEPMWTHDPRSRRQPDAPPSTTEEEEEILTPLSGKHILLVEDEALVAVEIEYALRDAGAIVLGPAASLETAIALAEQASQLDGAILDVDLGGDEDVFPLATSLTEQSVPLIFHTGVGQRVRMEAFLPNARICLKPVLVEELLADLADLLNSAEGSDAP